MNTAFDQTLAIAGLLSKKSLKKLLKIGLIWSIVTILFWGITTLWLTNQSFFRLNGAELDTQSQFLAIPLLFIVITAFVVSVITSSFYSLTFIANGATRKSVSIGSIINAAIVTLAVGIVSSVTYYLDALSNKRQLANSIAKAFSIPSPNGWLGLTTALLTFFMILIFGMVLFSLFIRWRWPVGLAVLILFTSGIVPEIGHYLLPDFSAAVARLFALPIGPALASVVLGLTYYTIMRKMPVR